MPTLALLISMFSIGLGSTLYNNIAPAAVDHQSRSLLIRAGCVCYYGGALGALMIGLCALLLGKA